MINTTIGKRQFITDLCNNLRDRALARAAAFPEEWDGHELRVYLAELFTAQCSAPSAVVKRWPEPVLMPKRGWKYRNTCLVQNL